jgi:hypothetical protein
MTSLTSHATLPTDGDTLVKGMQEGDTQTVYQDPWARVDVTKGNKGPWARIYRTYPNIAVGVPMVTPYLW